MIYLEQNGNKDKGQKFILPLARYPRFDIVGI